MPRVKRRRATPKGLYLGVFLSIYLLMRVAYFDISVFLRPMILATGVAYSAKQESTGSIQAIVHQPPLVPGVKGEPCRYDGHCGVGMTCAIDLLSKLVKSHGGGGICQPFVLATKNVSIETSACAQRCLEGLPRNAILEDVSQSPGGLHVGRPDACVLTFRHAPGHARSEYDDIKFNNATIERRIIRRDPILQNTSGDGVYYAEKDGQLLWNAICYEPCNGSCTEGFLCIGHVCRRDESYWKTSDSEMVIITGANSKFFGPLQNLVGSLRYWAPSNKIVVYNLGLDPEEVNIVESWDNVLDVKWKTGIPATYPEHLRKAKAYAWKPVAINESLHEYKQIFWLDAGSTVVGPITEAIRITQQNGIFLVWGQDEDMKPKSFTKTYSAFGYDKATFRGGPHYSGNTQAYLYPSRYVDTVVIPNAQCALLPDCIMPEGSEVVNHRYDQTTLSILSHREDLSIPHYTLYLAAERKQLASSLREPSEKFIWTSRGSCWEFERQVVSKRLGMQSLLPSSSFQSSLRDDDHPQYRLIEADT